MSKTEVVFILDKSGSMCGLEDDTIGGFNATINSQKEGDGEVLVSTVLFSDNSEVLHDRVRIEEIQPMTKNDYRVGGCTALLDAIGNAIHHIGNIHKYARKEDIPDHTIFFITTDGYENASHKYSREKIKDLISHQTEKYGWEFIFLAANIDAVTTAESIGIRRERAVDCYQDNDGIKAQYKCMENVLYCTRSNTPLDKSEWRKEADREKIKRSKKSK